jgi:hypothetical protein
MSEMRAEASYLYKLQEGKPVMRKGNCRSFRYPKSLDGATGGLQLLSRPLKARPYGDPSLTFTDDTI